MGQYYTALAIDGENKVKKLKPYEFDSFNKLWEHAWIGNKFVNAVYSLLHDRPCKIAWIGDYSDNPYDPNADAYAKALTHEEFMRMYKIAWGKAEPLKSSNFTRKQLKLVNRATKRGYLVNHDLKCYLDMAAYIRRSTKANGQCFNPLPLLTACGNSRGNGDYEGQSCYEDVGTWAFHRLEYTDRIPEGYSEKEYRFIEERDTCTVFLSVNLDEKMKHKN